MPPQVSVILTEATWVAAQADRDRRRAALTTFGFTTTDTDEVSGRSDTTSDSGCEAGPAVLPVLGYAPATLEDGTPVPASELGVIMCDCELTRIVINSHGVPLDLGRTERLFTGPQRKAVIARDRECAWPDCHAHARWCHIHHLAWWQRDNGVTSVENGALLCNYHHHEVHRLDLTLTRHTAHHDGITGIARVWYQFTDPTGRTLQQTGPPGIQPPAPPRPPAPPNELDLTQVDAPIDAREVYPDGLFQTSDARVA